MERITAENKTKRFKFLFGAGSESIADFAIVSPFFPVKSLSDKLKNKNNFKGALFRGVTGFYEGKKVSFINTGIGQSLLSDCVMALEITACKKIVFLGSCGAVDDLRVGSCVIIEQARIDAEYFENFLPGVFPESRAGEFYAGSVMAAAAKKIFLQKKINPAEIKLMSINSLWDQDCPDKFLKLKEKNVQAVDLETAFFYALCRNREDRFHGRYLSLCFISDHLRTHPYWDSFSLDQKNGLKKAVELLVGVALELSSAV